MPKVAKELSALAVGQIKTSGWTAVGGVPGLGLQVVGNSKSWILRLSMGGRRPEMGLGPYPEVSLAMARRRAAAERDSVRAGINPIDALRSRKRAEAATRAASKTFAECARAYVDAKSPEWGNPKHISQWSTTLATYTFPLIGELRVSAVDTPHILSVLEPIWTTKTETAARLRGRLENILDWATVRGYRVGTNPARWRGHLDKLLPKPGKVAKVRHHSALPYQDVPAFLARLENVDGVGARAMRFLILCASRSGEVRGARWEEIDPEARIWTIPATRMKAGREHRVPLSDEASKVIASLPRTAGLIFVSPRGGRQLSDMTLTLLLRRMQVDAVPHGFRSSFRDWVAEQTSHPRELAEKALAHTLPDPVEAAYQRGDMLERRRELMQAWARHCTKKRRLLQPTERGRGASR